MKTIHKCFSTGDAYDCSNCDDDFKIGDILVIPTESVIGFVWAWPFAITIDHGALHYVDPKLDLQGWKDQFEDLHLTMDDVKQAVDLADKLGFAVLDVVRRYVNPIT